MSDRQQDASFCLHKRSRDDDDSLSQSDEDNTSTSSDASIITVIPSHIHSPSTRNEDEEQLAEDNVVVDALIELSNQEQPPEILTTLKSPLSLCKSFAVGEFFYLVVYEFQVQQSKPAIGTCTLRFGLDDARIKDRSQEALQQLEVAETDVWIRDTNCIFYDKIDD
ncbi:hypothetical protein ACLKA6_019166 [Drosophila palustris]